MSTLNEKTSIENVSRLALQTILLISWKKFQFWQFNRYYFFSIARQIGWEDIGAVQFVVDRWTHGQWRSQIVGNNVNTPFKSIECIVHLESIVLQIFKWRKNSLAKFQESPFLTGPRHNMGRKVELDRNAEIVSIWPPWAPCHDAPCPGDDHQWCNASVETNAY